MNVEKKYLKHAEASDVDKVPTDPVAYGAPHIYDSITIFCGFLQVGVCSSDGKQFLYLSYKI